MSFNPPQPSPVLLVLSGPSGVGKDALLERMKERHLPLQYITTATTRPQRRREVDGKDYHFVSQAEFKKLMKPAYDRMKAIAGEENIAAFIKMVDAAK